LRILRIKKAVLIVALARYAIRPRIHALDRGIVRACSLQFDEYQ